MEKGGKADGRPGPSQRTFELGSSARGFYDRASRRPQLQASSRFSPGQISRSIRSDFVALCAAFGHVAISAVLELSSRVASSVRHVQLQENFCAHIRLRLRPDRCFVVTEHL